MTAGPHVGILFIGTGRYVKFFADFLVSFDRHWFPGTKRTYFVYSDLPPNADPRVVWQPTEHEPWPLPTLHRFDYFLSSAAALTQCTHLVFANSNLRPLVDIPFHDVFDDTEMLFGVLHPGYAFVRPGLLRRRYPGSFETNIDSTAFIGPGKRRYFAGGLNGGTTGEWLRMCGYLSVNIRIDKARGVNGTGYAVWHDESHTNFYFNRCMRPKALGAEYLYPEGWSLPVTPKILVLDKTKHGGHDYMRHHVP